MAKTITYLCSEAQAEHERVYGGFNDFPPNWKRCTPNEFWGKFNCYGIGEKVEYRQMHTEGAIVMAHLFFYHDDTGLGLVHCYENGKHRPPLLYKFARCEHDMVAVHEKSYMHYHVSKCRKCGYERGVDSSG
jgi:hypothetical protein